MVELRDRLATGEGRVRGMAAAPFRSSTPAPTSHPFPGGRALSKPAAAPRAWHGIGHRYTELQGAAPLSEPLQPLLGLPVQLLLCRSAQLEVRPTIARCSRQV
jgi:hypothetical protein